MAKNVEGNPMAIKHYVVQTTDTSTATEKLANQQLIDAGFPTTWLATVEQRTIRRCTRSIVKSLFPGYLFVAFDVANDAWQKIPHLSDVRGRGVERILGAGPYRPTALPIGALERLQRDFEAGEFKPRLETGFVKGDQLSVLAGPFSGHIGVCQMSDEERVAVLLKMFGRSAVVSFRRDMLRRAS